MQLQVKGKNVEVSDSIRSYAEATIWTKGPVLRAREASTDMKASIDQLTEKLIRQVKHYRESRQDHRRPRGPAIADPGGFVTEDGAEPQIVKTKQFAVKPMSAEEAVLQLELVGHDFFVFQNADSSDINVVYRRRGGGYGLIEPQT